MFITWNSAENLREFINIELCIGIEVKVSEDSVKRGAIAGLIVPESAKLCLCQENITSIVCVKVSEIFFGTSKAFQISLLLSIISKALATNELIKCKILICIEVTILENFCGAYISLEVFGKECCELLS